MFPDRLLTQFQKFTVLAALFALVAGFGLLLAAPDFADAALKSAAGGGAGNAGGFSRFVSFLDKLADYLVPVGAALCPLALIRGGALYTNGDARGGQYLAYAGVGLAIVLLAKPITA